MAFFVISPHLDPRFCIHSWKDQGITTPWMYEEQLPIIRDAIKFRYKLVPYLYSLSKDAATHGTPIIRPLFFEFQDDTNTFNLSFEFMLGPWLLVASVYEPNQTCRSLYLPSTMWHDYWNSKWYNGGQEVTVDVPLSQHGALFVRSGGMIPMTPNPGRCIEPREKERTILLFPDRLSGQSVYVVSDDVLSESVALIQTKISMTWTPEKVMIDLVTISKMNWNEVYDGYTFELPRGDDRLLVCGDLSRTHSLFVPIPEVLERQDLSL